MKLGGGIGQVRLLLYVENISHGAFRGFVSVYFFICGLVFSFSFLFLLISCESLNIGQSLLMQVLSSK